MGGSASSGTPAAATLGAGCPGVMRAATGTPLHTSYTSPSDVCPWNTCEMNAAAGETRVMRHCRNTSEQ